MSNKRMQKVFAYICLFSLSVSNIYSMERQHSEQVHINEKPIPNIVGGEENPDILPAPVSSNIEDEQNCNPESMNESESNGCCEEENYTPISEHFSMSDEEICRPLFPFIGSSDKYKESPTKSKLMLQKPEMSDSLRKHVYSMSPQRIKNIIGCYKRHGKRAFTKQFIKLAPRTTLLYGPNGTGKSTLGVLIAKELEIELKKKKVELKLLFLNSGFLGTMYRKSEEVNLSEQVAPLLDKGFPCVIVFDEADALVGKGDDEDKFNRNRSAAVGQMMDMMNKKSNFILVWTTNYIDEIEEKFKSRLGRHSKVEVPLPNFKHRKQILEFIIKEAKKSSDNYMIIGCETLFDLDSIAKKSKNLSIRDLEELLREAFLMSSTRLPEIKESVEEDSQKREPLVIVLTDQDFIKACAETLKDISKDKGAARRKKILKIIVKYGLIGVTVTVVLGVAGGGLTFYMFKVGQANTIAIAAKARMANYITAGASICASFGLWLLSRWFPVPVPAPK